jgi:hypothetical protein
MDFTTRNRLVCKDGATVSVQAGRWLYSFPKADGELYTHVEAGFPEGSVPTSWILYAESPDDLNNTVYPYLPYHLLFEFIDLHGGTESEDLPPWHPPALYHPFFISQVRTK